MDANSRCVVAQHNPSALEITGLPSADGNMYDPAGDDDPTTGVSCSATAPLLVALASAASLTLASFVNCTAILKVNPILVRRAHCKLAWLYARRNSIENNQFAALIQTPLTLR